jgi:sugar phosphate isomerase/epimerase
MPGPQVGIQLIIFGRRAQDDFPGVLRDVAAAGYAGIECGNLYARYSREEVQRMLDSTGLSITGIHSGYGDFSDPEKVRANIQFLNDVGAGYMMCSGVSNDGEGLDRYANSVKVFNEVGRQCREAGIWFCYHNHNWEFETYNGRRAIDFLAAETDPAAVKLNIDIYWVAVGGDDPAAFVRRYKDRCTYFHFKDGQWEPGSPGKATHFDELGRGSVDFETAVPAALECRPDWIVTEQDRTDGDPAESARISRDFLKSRFGL